MKKIFLLSTALLVFCFANAKIWTVCNNPAGVAQFNEIQQAIDSTVAGDTLLVQGSSTPYSDFNLFSKRVIIGPGWLPTRNGGITNSGTAKVQTVNIYAGASGTELQGLEFVSGKDLVIDNSTAVNDIKLIRNHFVNSVTIGYGGITGLSYSNYMIEGNWFDNCELRASKNPQYINFFIQNNIFYKSKIQLFQNSINVYIDHNLFYSDDPAGQYYPFWNWSSRAAASCDDVSVFSQNLDINNNIFVKVNLVLSSNVCYLQPHHESIKNCKFRNNITWNSNTTAPWTVNSNVDVGNTNINNQNPQFINTTQSAVTAGTNNPLLDFSITNGPANNSGTDGKDLGLLFDNTGSLNWTNSRNSRIPFVEDFNILTPNVGPGQQIKFYLKAFSNN